MISDTNLRESKGKELAQAKDCVKRINEKFYKVKSQAGNNKEYDVIFQENEDWYCSCPDSIYRKQKCKHIFAVEFSIKLREHVKQEITIEPVSISDCIFCHSSYLKKFGIRKNKSGSIQRFICGDCKRTFSINLGFEKMKHNPQAITTSIQLYFSGESLRNTQKSIR